MSPIGDVAIWNNKAIALSKMKRYKEAVECLDNALEFEPRNISIWGNKVLFLFELKKYNDVIECCDKILKIDPKCAEA